MAADKFRPHHPDEYQKLLSWAKGATSVLEIGSRYGFTLLDIADRMKEGRIVSVDLPGAGDWGNKDSESYLKGAIEVLKDKGFDAHLFLGDSKDPSIIEAVEELGPFDFVFIDGDHTYEGVLSDWNNYGHLGRRVVFHDIKQPGPGENQNLQVWKLWKELNGTEEFVAPGSKMGIGRIG